MNLFNLKCPECGKYTMVIYESGDKELACGHQVTLFITEEVYLI